MSTLTITSPGVQINEVDQSLTIRPLGATDILITGFASQGPTEEFINVSSISEYEQIFGTPSGPAEKYLYYSAKQILNTSPANLIVNRLPYGQDLGTGYANSYSALVYPVSTDSYNDTAYTDASNYRLLDPVSVLLTDDEYLSLTQNNIDWGLTPWSPATSATPLSSYSLNSITGYGSLSSAGLIVVNKTKTSINNLFEGYYVGICDNSDINPATSFVSITGVKSVISNNGSTQTFTIVPSNRFNFALSATSALGNPSVSEILETYPTGYDFSSNAFNDSLILVLFKIRTSIYNQDTVILDYVVSEGYAGSLNANKTQNNPNGGIPNTFYIEDVVNKKSNNIQVVINPYISKAGNWVNNDGTPKKTVRVDSSAKNLYSAGVYVANTDYTSKDVGDVPKKLARIINQIQSNDDFNIDIIAEAGLGTIYAGAKDRYQSRPNEPMFFDDETNVDLTPIKGTTTNSIPSGGVYDNYQAIVQQFVSLANEKKDHIFIADPIRNIFVQGKNGKTSAKKDYNFTTETYWPIRNLLGSIQSSYVVSYGNFLKVPDTIGDSFIWLPASGYVAANVASSSQTGYPWDAVAGFTRGVLTNVIDLGVNPVQKQRDILYKININPIAYFPNDGFVIYGQKTMYRQPSAFDRLNVRRLFLTLEKQTKALLKYYVFEPNSFTTQQRLVGALSPIFDSAKINNGLYDYSIVCDSRNNTPDVIDANQLKIAIYIQPTKTSEFILCDFIATTTGVNLQQVIG